MLTNFANLAGFKRKAAKAEEQDEEEEDPRARLEGESDEDYDARMADLDEEEEKAKKAKGSKKATRAEDEKDEADAEDEEDEKDADAKSARSRERARCAAIFSHPSAANNMPLAASLAFNSTMPRSQVIAHLKNAGHNSPAPEPEKVVRSGKQALSDRMSRQPRIDIGQDTPQAQNGPQGEAAGLIAKMTGAYKKAIGASA